MEKTQQFQDRLKRAMANAGLEFTGSALARHLKLFAKKANIEYPIKTRVSCYSWVTGKNGPAVEYLFFLARALGVNAEWLGTGMVAQPLRLHQSKSSRYRSPTGRAREVVSELAEANPHHAPSLNLT